MSLVGKDIRAIFNNLKNRGKLILMRTTGLMRDSNCLIQHFNPACRAARAVPHLPVARLLISIGDFDLPVPSQFKRYKRLRMLLSLVLWPLGSCPVLIQDGVTEMFSSAAFNALIMAIGTINRMNSSAGGAVIAIIVLALFFREGFIALRDWRKKKVLLDTAHANMFVPAGELEVDEDAILFQSKADELSSPSDAQAIPFDQLSATSNRLISTMRSSAFDPLQFINELYKDEEEKAGDSKGDAEAVKEEEEKRAVIKPSEADPAPFVSSSGPADIDIPPFVSTTSFMTSFERVIDGHQVTVVDGPPISASNSVHPFNPDDDENYEDMEDDLDLVSLGSSSVGSMTASSRRKKTSSSGMDRKNAKKQSHAAASSSSSRIIRGDQSISSSSIDTDSIHTIERRTRKKKVRSIERGIRMRYLVGTAGEDDFDDSTIATAATMQSSVHTRNTNSGNGFNPRSRSLSLQLAWDNRSDDETAASSISRPRRKRRAPEGGPGAQSNSLVGFSVPPPEAATFLHEDLGNMAMNMVDVTSSAPVWPSASVNPGRGTGNPRAFVPRGSSPRQERLGETKFPMFS